MFFSPPPRYFIVIALAGVYDDSQGVMDGWEERVFLIESVSVSVWKIACKGYWQKGITVWLSH